MIEKGEHLSGVKEKRQNFNQNIRKKRTDDILFRKRLEYLRDLDPNFQEFRKNKQEILEQYQNVDQQLASLKNLLDKTDTELNIIAIHEAVIKLRKFISRHDIMDTNLVRLLEDKQILKVIVKILSLSEKAEIQQIQELTWILANLCAVKDDILEAELIKDGLMGTLLDCFVAFTDVTVISDIILGFANLITDKPECREFLIENKIPQKFLGLLSEQSIKESEDYSYICDIIMYFFANLFALKPYLQFDFYINVFNLASKAFLHKQDELIPDCQKIIKHSIYASEQKHFYMFFNKPLLLEKIVYLANHDDSKIAKRSCNILSDLLSSDKIDHISKLLDLNILQVLFNNFERRLNDSALIFACLNCYFNLVACRDKESKSRIQKKPILNSMFACWVKYSECSNKIMEKICRKSAECFNAAFKEDNAADLIEFQDENFQFINFVLNVLKDTSRKPKYILKCLALLDKIFTLGDQQDFSTENPYCQHAYNSTEWEGTESVQKHPSESVYLAMNKLQEKFFIIDEDE